VCPGHDEDEPLVVDRLIPARRRVGLWLLLGSVHGERVIHATTDPRWMCWSLCSRCWWSLLWLCSPCSCTG